MSQSAASPTMPTERPTTSLETAHAHLDNTERQLQEDGDMSMKQNECFFLERIPGEIRNRIYEFALTGDDSVATLKFTVLVPKPPYISPEDKRVTQSIRARELKQERMDLRVALGEVQRQAEALVEQFQECRAMIEAENHREEMQKLDRETNEREDSTLLRKRVAREREMLSMQKQHHILRRKIPKMEHGIHDLAEREKRVLEGKEEFGPIFDPNADITIEDDDIVSRKLSFRDVDNVFALSRTCKRIRHECYSLAHEYNSFRFVTRMIERDSAPVHRVDWQLKHIATRQFETREIQRGVIIDLGNFSHDHGEYSSLAGLEVYLRTNSESLRKLHKSTEFLKLAFVTGVDDQTGSRDSRFSVKVEWELPLSSPEAILAYFDQKARSETRLRGEEVRRARAKVLRVFFPVWAVKNNC